MTGTGIPQSVNRAFVTMGMLFLLGGLYYGPLLYFDPDASSGVVSVQGKVETLRTERVRPLGFENIPVDSDDPDHAHIPVNTNMFATVSTPGTEWTMWATSSPGGNRRTGERGELSSFIL